jgi:hypothetical protein
VGSKTRPTTPHTETPNSATSPDPSIDVTGTAMTPKLPTNPFFVSLTGFWRQLSRVREARKEIGYYSRTYGGTR